MMVAEGMERNKNKRESLTVSAYFTKVVLNLVLMLMNLQCFNERLHEVSNLHKTLTNHLYIKAFRKTFPCQPF